MSCDERGLLHDDNFIETINNYMKTKEEFFPIIEDLLYQKEIKKSVRLLGISITNLYLDNFLPKKEFSVQLKFDL